MWYPTNKTGPSEGIPASPFTTVPSSKVESITALVTALIKLEAFQVKGGKCKLLV
jgi:hypothetical protein